MSVSLPTENHFKIEKLPQFLLQIQTAKSIGLCPFGQDQFLCSGHAQFHLLFCVI